MVSIATNHDGKLLLPRELSSSEVFEWRVRVDVGMFHLKHTVEQIPPENKSDIHKNKS